MEKEIEVINCWQCPFVNEDSYGYIGCNINYTIREWVMPSGKVHNDCPLKYDSVTVKLKR